MEHYEDEFYNEEDKKALYYECVNALVELAGHYGLEGNLWHAYLAFVIANGENAFTACEVWGREGQHQPAGHAGFSGIPGTVCL